MCKSAGSVVSEIKLMEVVYWPYFIELIELL